MTATSIKISQLPSASTPLTGAEIMPLAKNRQNVKVGIGAVQIPQPLGDLPPNTPVGTLGYIVDAAGGPVPAYSNGTSWQQFGGTNGPINVMGPGIWVVGAGASNINSPAHRFALFGQVSGLAADQGWFFYSIDGRNWIAAAPTLPSGGLFGRGFTAMAYASGCWLLEGLQGVGVNPSTPIVATLRDPTNYLDPNVGVIYAAPRGYTNPAQIGFSPLPLTMANGGNYDNDTGVFTVPFRPSGTVLVQNTLPPAVVTANWPTVGQDDEVVVEGMGTNGPVEVRISGRDFVIDPPGVVKDTQILVTPGPYFTNFLEWRPSGSSDWQPVISQLGALNGERVTNAGLILRGLVWGPVRQLAVEFQRGDL